MKIVGKRSLMASGSLLALAAFGVLATQTGARAQVSAGECGAGGGNLCKEVKTCIGTECVTVSNYYKPAPEQVI